MSDNIRRSQSWPGSAHPARPALPEEPLASEHISLPDGAVDAVVPETSATQGGSGGNSGSGGTGGTN